MDPWLSSLVSFYGYTVRKCYSTIIQHLFLLTDIDECASPETNECDTNAECSNTEGSYTCSCRVGYTGDGKSCAGSQINFGCISSKFQLLLVEYLSKRNEIIAVERGSNVCVRFTLCTISVDIGLTVQENRTPLICFCC